MFPGAFFALAIGMSPGPSLSYQRTRLNSRWYDSDAAMVYCAVAIRIGALLSKSSKKRCCIAVLADMRFDGS